MRFGLVFVAVATLSAAALAQGPAARLTAISHIGLVVRDAGRVSKAWQDVFSVAAGKPRQVAGATVIDVRLDNLTIELLQPAGGGSAWRSFLDAHGEGVHHVAFESGDVEGAATALAANGGRRIAALRDRGSAFVDFDNELGGAIEVVPSTAGAPTAAAGGAGTYVTAIGHLTADAERARRFWAGVTGVEIPPARDTKGVPFPADCQCDRNAYIREVNIRLPVLGINLIQPEGGPSVWRRLIEQHEGIDYLQFGLPSQEALDARIALLLRHGGTRTLGADGAPYAYIDMQERLGLTLLLVRSAR